MIFDEFPKKQANKQILNSASQ